MAYLKINGVEITNLVEYDDLLSTQDGDGQRQKSSARHEQGYSWTHP